MSNADERQDRGYVLVVDDTLANLRLLVDLLTNEGYRVKGVPNGKLALRLATTEAPDVILLDINMPGMNGYEVCERLKADPASRDVPVIFVSALDDVFDKVRGFSVGAVDYVTKPIEAAEVLARLETHLSIVRLQQELRAANEWLEAKVAERTQELREQMETFRKFVPDTFAPDQTASFSATEKIYSVLSCDVREFSTFSESVTAAECYEFLNGFFALVEPAIRAAGGAVYQYIGDEIVALFEPVDGATDNAVRAAIEIQRRIREDAAELRHRPASLRVGIGINTGPIAIGVAGTDKRLGVCAFGSTVNVASRCEQLTKELPADIVLTAACQQRLAVPDELSLSSLGLHELRGLQQPVALFGAGLPRRQD
ncbi:MAG: response regulator [Pseudomonadota bacterium]